MQIVKWRTGHLRELGTSGAAILRSAATHFYENRAKRLSAGLAYYALFALVPSLLLAVAVAAAFVGKEAATGELAAQMSDTIGVDASEQLESAIATLWTSTSGSNFALLSVGTVVFSASVLFTAWRDTIEFVWDVPLHPSLKTTFRTRAFAALVPIGAGLLLAATMLMQGLLTFVQELVASSWPDFTLRSASAALETVVSVLALVLMFRYSARRTRPAWGDIWPAVIMVVLVLNLGFWAYGLYVRFIGTSSITGAASSAFLAVLVVYYGAQTLLFGAEVIAVLGRRRSSTATEPPHDE